MAINFKFNYGIYQFNTLYYINVPDPTLGITDPSVRDVLPYRGIKQQDGDDIKAEDFNQMQENMIYSVSAIYNQATPGTDIYEITNFTNALGNFEGLKIRMIIPRTNSNTKTQIKSGDTLFDVNKRVNNLLVDIEVGDLQQNQILDFTLSNNKFLVSLTNSATDTTPGLVTLQQIQTMINNTVNTSITNIIPIPIGGLHITTDNTDPSTIWPTSTWELISPGRVLIGQDINNDLYKTLGGTGGNQTVTLNTANMPAHNHSCSTNGDHSHGMNVIGNHYHVVDNHAHYVPPHQHVSPWGEVAGIYNPPWGLWTEGGPRIGSNKVDYDNYWGYTSPTDVWSHGAAPNTNYTGDHAHTIYNSGNHAHTIGNAGSGTAFNIIQPYLVVKIWKRKT